MGHVPTAPGVPCHALRYRLKIHIFCTVEQDFGTTHFNKRDNLSMPKTTPAKSPTPSTRESKRVRKTPQRFRPGSDLPSELSEMIRNIASKAAQKSNIPFQVDALGTLEDALEGILEKVFVAAYDKAKSRGSSEIDAKDIQEVHTMIMSHKAGEA